MALSVTRARVKEKCGISDTTYDTTIDNLILELVPVTEFRIRPDHLASADPGLTATLNLAATELVSGELLAQLARGPGWSERVKLGELELTTSPSGLTEKGEARLRPFLKDKGFAQGPSVVATPEAEPA